MQTTTHNSKHDFISSELQPYFDYTYFQWHSIVGLVAIAFAIAAVMVISLSINKFWILESLNYDIVECINIRKRKTEYK